MVHTDFDNIDSIAKRVLNQTEKYLSYYNLDKFYSSKIEDIPNGVGLYVNTAIEGENFFIAALFNIDRSIELSIAHVGEDGQLDLSLTTNLKFYDRLGIKVPEDKLTENIQRNYTKFLPANMQMQYERIYEGIADSITILEDLRGGN